MTGPAVEDHVTQHQRRRGSSEYNLCGIGSLHWGNRRQWHWIVSAHTQSENRIACAIQNIRAHRPLRGMALNLENLRAKGYDIDKKDWQRIPFTDESKLNLCHGRVWAYRRMQERVSPNCELISWYGLGFVTTERHNYWCNEAALIPKAMWMRSCDQ